MASTKTKAKAKPVAKAKKASAPKAKLAVAGVQNLHLSTTTATPLADVDISDVPAVDSEPLTPLTAESWVILGEHPSVPDWAVGKPAGVISAPQGSLKPDDLVTVRERSQGAMFELPASSFEKLAPTHGRLGIVHPA